MIRRTLLASFFVAFSQCHASNYEFTYTNPSIGDPQAPFVLEYFSRVDCEPCRQFEMRELGLLLDSVDAGTLRIIFRDLLPDPVAFPASNFLFCLQEYDEYLNWRVQAKRDSVYRSDSLPTLRGRARARHESCMDSDASIPVLTHNQAVFDSHSLIGTPAFQLFRNDRDASAIRRWSGPISARQLLQWLTHKRIRSL